MSVSPLRPEGSVVETNVDTNNKPPTSNEFKRHLSIEAKTHNLYEGYSHEGLRLQSIETDHDETETNQPDIDVIHVMGVGAEEDRLSLDTLLSSVVVSKKRELIFKTNILGLFAGDFTANSIELQAMQLLRGLTHFRQHDEKPTRRALVFVAYDLGALIVKKAISIVALNKMQWPTIFRSSARFIFSGCFQRWASTRTLEMKLFEFLSSKRDKSWAQYLTPMSIKSHAKAVIEMTELFISSKITLINRVVSLYANETMAGNLHEVFDHFTATLGVPLELQIEEETSSKTESFPTLNHKVCYQIEYWATPRTWEPLEHLLLSLTAAPRQIRATSYLRRHPLIASLMNKQWMTSNSPRLLRVRGADRHATRAVAEQVLLCWEANQQDKKRNGYSAFSFSFSSRDPSRSSIVNMISSFFLQFFLSSIELSDEDYLLMEESFKLLGTRTEADLLKLFEIQLFTFTGHDLLMVLHDIEECDLDGLKNFWKILTRLATATERSLKFVVTYTRQLELPEQSTRWPKDLVEEFTVPTKEQPQGDFSEIQYAEVLTSSLCPNGHGEAEIQKSLKDLLSMDKEMLDGILKLIKNHTDWPEGRSAKGLCTFCSLLQVTTPLSTSQSVLDKMLRSVPDQDGLRWMLNWLLCGHRPLTRWELAGILCHHRCKSIYTEPSNSDLQESLIQIESWFRGLLEFSNDQVYIRDDVWQLLEFKAGYIWSEIRETASKTILNFVHTYLILPDVQEHLKSIFVQYHRLVETSKDNVTCPLASNGQDIILYAVQAIPYHLSENLEISEMLGKQLVATDGPMMAWAKIYWAISNPASRPKVETLKSAYDALMKLGSPSPSVISTLEKLVEIREGGTEIHGCQKSSELGELDSLVEIVKADDEDTALTRTNKIVSTYKDEQKNSGGATVLEESVRIPWPPSLVWIATWHGMGRLITLLLENGMNPDPDDTRFKAFPSPLYMAALLGYRPVVDALLSKGAKTSFPRAKVSNPLCAAASQGHIDIIKSLATHSGTLLDQLKPAAPLYTASVLGNWQAVAALLELKANPNAGIQPDTGAGWAPLVGAAGFAHEKTTQILLEDGADPNVRGPDNEDTVLWFAAVEAGSVECVRLLLKKRADPNHELIKPPLLIEVIEDGTPADDKIMIFDALLDAPIPVQLDNANIDTGMTAMMHAARKGETSVIKWLLEHGANINVVDQHDRSALFHATNNRRVDVVRELLKWRPDLNALDTSGETLLQIALNDIVIFEMLLDAGADIELLSGDESTIINDAVAEGKLEVVQLLVERYVDIHHLDRYGWSPILDAVGYNMDAEITRTLIEAGADLRDTTEEGQTTLHLARSPEVFKVLLEFRKMVDMEKCDKNGRTPLLEVGLHNSLECIKLLIRAGANVNAQDSQGSTALMAALDGRMPLEAADLLLSQAEINTSLHSHVYGAALHIACQTLNLDFVTKLIKHGANINQQLRDFPSNPLMAACAPRRGSRSENLDKMEQIVRLLVANGAEVNTMDTIGDGLYNAISTASLVAGAGTIFYLLDHGASTQIPDPLGRLPIHFAAANGIENFEAIASVHRGDLMVTDKGGKNVLHWAAQFGHIQTVDAILSRLGVPEAQRKEYIDRTDIDGWTPLCWATRPFHGGWIAKMNSEPREYDRTVRYLIEKGAHRDIEFRMGNQTFTPLKLAELCDAGDEMIHLLTFGVDESPSGNSRARNRDAVQKYSFETETACDVCLNGIYGLTYQCNSCAHFYACSKCYGRIDVYHSHLTTQAGEQHTFRIRAGHEKEFQDSIAPDTDLASPDLDQDRMIHWNRRRKSSALTFGDVDMFRSDSSESESSDGVGEPSEDGEDDPDGNGDGSSAED